MSLDCPVELRSERHYYSVPFRLVGEVVDVRTSAGTVEVFYHYNRVASHVPRYRPGYRTQPAHMPESHRRHAGWTQGLFRYNFSAYVWKEPCAVAIDKAELDVRAQHPSFVPRYDPRLRLIP